jgi:hypothetical protein
MQDLKVRSLDARQLGSAYPLIRSATHVSQQRWEEFGRELIESGGGVLAVISPDGCIHGVAAFRPSPNLRHEQSLDVEVIVAFELQGDDRVREQLCSELRHVAAAYRCRTVNFTMAARNYGEPLSPARAALERLGMRLETVNFIREL